jgi:hypothetical protein
MVKNSEDNDKLLVCAEENKVYLWKATDGKVSNSYCIPMQADKIHKLIMILHTILYKVPIQQASFSILHTTVQMLSTKFLRRRMAFIGSNYLEIFQKR